MPVRPGAAALLVILALLATGCVAPGGTVEPDAEDLAGSPERFDLDSLLVERLPLALADGVTLDVAVFRPDVEKAGVPDEKLPVLADVGPYYGNAGGPMLELTGFDQRLAEYFVPRGYAVARVSLRGTGDSEGCFRVGDLQEQQDVADAVEFLASQPWSNGNVALIGKSYDGTTPWMAAVTSPPSLRTIVPISGISDMYRYSFYEGAAYPETAAFHTYYPLFVDYDVDTGVPPTSDPTAHLMANAVRTCADIAPDSVDAGITYATGDHGTAFWQERDYEPRMKDVKVPVFLVHGLQDWNVKPDNGIPQYGELDVPKAMWLGQWNHDYPDINRFNADWSRHDWNETLLTWFDHWLKGQDNAWESIAHVEVQDHLGTWRNYAAWPPADADALHLAPAQDGSLLVAPEGEGALMLTDMGAGFDPAKGSGGAAFLTAPLPANATLLGAPSVDAHLTLMRPSGTLTVALYDVAPDGAWTEVAHGARSLRHRDGRDHGSPVTPGQRFNTTVPMYSQETTLLAGHRLALVLAPSAPDHVQQDPFALGGMTTVHLGPEATMLHVLLRATDGAALGAAAVKPG
jgi:predicted acyl esterase